MKITLSKAACGAALFASVVALIPAIVSAQDAAMSDPNANVSAIGYLVIWLLGIGGAIAIVAMSFSDRMARSSRISRK